MDYFKKRRLAIATTVYWLLLIYIVAALVWWFIALQTQNRQMTIFKLNELKKDDTGYTINLDRIEKESVLKTTRNIGEGSAFLLVILLGAIFVYRAVRRQFRLQQQQQNFMMAITHELKTPIAVAKLNLETMQKYRLEESVNKKLIQSALQEIVRLNNLSSNILVSAQLEGGKYAIAREDIDFSAMTISLINDWKNRYPERKWSVNIKEEQEVTGDPVLLPMLINNLIENAIKYSPKDTIISIDLITGNESVLLKIKDLGIGIRSTERKKVFEKFYRSGNEQTRTAQGTGLGLYLCKKIATDHNAQILIEDNSPTGTIFTVVFKKSTVI